VSAAQFAAFDVLAFCFLFCNLQFVVCGLQFIVFRIVFLVGGLASPVCGFRFSHARFSYNVLIALNGKQVTTDV